jgi:hypothetical protein
VACNHHADAEGDHARRKPVAEAGVPDGVVSVVTGYVEPRRSIDRPGSRWQA